MKKEYYDSLVTRLYMDMKNKEKSKNYYSDLKKIWNKKDILIVEGDKTRLGIGNDLFQNVNTIKRIICPSKDTFSFYEEIFKSITFFSKDTLILISLGPTATVLAYDLCLNGYRALDVGHIDIEYEWFLNQDIEKKPVKYKYIGEIANGDIVENLEDEIYFEQIKKIIK